MHSQRSYLLIVLLALTALLFSACAVPVAPADDASPSTLSKAMQMKRRKMDLQTTWRTNSIMISLPNSTRTSERKDKVLDAGREALWSAPLLRRFGSTLETRVAKLTNPKRSRCIGTALQSN